MTSATYSLQLFSPYGQPLGDLNAFESFDCALVERDVGALTVTLPPSYRYDRFQKDGRIALYRSIAGRPPALVGGALWLIRRRQRQLQGKKRSIVVRALHANTLLRRRIIAYDSGTANTSKTGAADDLMKAFAREQLTTATDTTRNLPTALFSVQADTSLGPTIHKAATRRNLLAVCQELSNAATEAGTYVGFEVGAVGTGALELRTYVGQRGVDRRSTTEQPLILSVDASLGDIEADEDWTNEVSSVYAGGQGEGSDRAIGTATDSGIIGSSPFGLIEDFYQDNQTSDQQQLDDDAASQLHAQRARVLISASVNDIPGATFGLHYDWGDLVSGQFDDLLFDSRVDPVRIQFDKSQGERLDIRLRNL